MSSLARWVIVLAMTAVGFFPSGGRGLVLCVDSGPDAHVAVEWGPCNVSRFVPAAPPAPLGASAECETQCTACTDLPLPMWETRRIVRLQVSTVDIAPSSAEGFVIAPGPVAGPTLHATGPRVRTSPSLPLALRI